MSDDLVRIVKLLIDSGKGDKVRLEEILYRLKEGQPIDVSEQNYVQELASKLEADHIDDQIDHNNTPHYEPPQQNSDKTKHEITVPSRKKVIIVAAAIFSIVFVYVILDTYSVSMLQFRSHTGSEYQISPTQIHIQAEACNPSFFPASFNLYQIDAFYKEKEIENAKIAGTTISPNTKSVIDGVFSLNSTSLLTLQQENASYDPTLAKITTTVDAPIFGVIPFSIVKEYSAEKFKEILNGPSGSFSCS